MSFLRRSAIFRFPPAETETAGRYPLAADAVGADPYWLGSGSGTLFRPPTSADGPAGSPERAGRTPLDLDQYFRVAVSADCPSRCLDFRRRLGRRRPTARGGPWRSRWSLEWRAIGVARPGASSEFRADADSARSS